MGWIADQTTRRIYDPDTGYEVRILDSGGSGDATIRFILLGFEVDHHFSADKDFPKISDDERLSLGLSEIEEMVVWKVSYARPQVQQNTVSALLTVGRSIRQPEYQVEQAIVSALLAYKSVWGFHYLNSVYFVRFAHEERLHR